MKTRGDPRRRCRAAAALVALTLLPVAIMAGATHGSTGAAQAATGLTDSLTLWAQDAETPTAEAAQRGVDSGLFAPFSWDGLVASGPFVRFDYIRDTGAILDYRAVNGTQSTAIVESITADDFAPTLDPLVSGATFAATSNGLVIIAHDEPMGLLEVRTLGEPHNVTLRFPYDTLGLQTATATKWPASTLSFTDGNLSGRIILGHGALSVAGTTVTASLAPWDYLAIRAVPAFAEHAAERTALLDAFASGRLAAEFDLVAVSNGGWLENSAQYHAVLGAVDSSVVFNRATISLGMRNPAAGLVLFEFDPMTMPVDAQHRLVVRANGSDIPQTQDPLASLFSLPGSSDHPAYVRLAMNATVIAVYVPDLGSTSIQIESGVVPQPGLDRPTQLAIVAALFVVSLAAAVMFRRQPA